MQFNHFNLNFQTQYVYFSCSPFYMFIYGRYKYIVAKLIANYYRCHTTVESEIAIPSTASSRKSLLSFPSAWQLLQTDRQREGHSLCNTHSFCTLT